MVCFQILGDPSRVYNLMYVRYIPSRLVELLDHLFAVQVHRLELLSYMGRAEVVDRGPG